jgi:hypothetical protein
VWHTFAGILSIAGNLPQDVVEGQIATGIDDSLNWYVGGTWYGAVPVSAMGNPPQDAVNGQIVVGSNSVCWFSSYVWWGFVV